MKGIFSNKGVRTERDEASDLRKKNKETVDAQQSPTAPPTYYYHAPSASVTTDLYSHTANSTAGYSQTSAYPRLTTYNQEHVQPTLPGKIESTATNHVENVVRSDIPVSTANKLNSAVTNGRNARELLQSGALVQLVSKNSGCLLQVVMTSSGALAFDGNGASNSFNSYFTVEEGEKGRLRFHNNCNYLAFDGKQACILSLPPGPKNNSNIDFRIHDIPGSTELVALESCSCKNHFISILPNGHLKTTNIKDKNIDAQFSVVSVMMSQQAMFPYQTQPYQQLNMNPHGPDGYAPPQPPMYYQQSSAPSAPPPSSYSTQDPYSQPSTSSGLYPQFH